MGSAPRRAAGRQGGCDALASGGNAAPGGRLLTCGVLGVECSVFGSRWTSRSKSGCAVGEDCTLIAEADAVSLAERRGEVTPRLPLDAFERLHERITTRRACVAV